MLLDRFLEPCDEMPPTGVDLDALGEIVALDMLAKWGSADTETDWRELLTRSEMALQRSRDLRAATYLTAALLPIEGIEGFCDGLRMIRTLLEVFWDDVHPRADEDGEFMERSSALFNLTNYHKVLKPLRMATLVDFRPVGRFSLFDVEIADGSVEAPEDYPGSAPTEGLIAAAFQGADGDALRALTGKVAQAVSDVETIETRFREQAGADQAPDMTRLRDGLRRVLTVLRNHVPSAAGPDEVSDQPAGAPPVTEPAVAGIPGEIRNRQDALAAMERISEYFHKHEPSSPIPILMARARRLVDMDFLTLLQDIAPQAVDEAMKLHGHSTEP